MVNFKAHDALASRLTPSITAVVEGESDARQVYDLLGGEADDVLTAEEAGSDVDAVEAALSRCLKVLFGFENLIFHPH